MNRYLIVSGIAVLLICVGLSGCTDNVLNPEMNRFVGTWIDNEQSYEVITFFSDGTCTMLGTKYEIKDGKLVFIVYMDGNEHQLPYDYTFSDNDNTLSLTAIGSSTTKVYTKQ